MNPGGFFFSPSFLSFLWIFSLFFWIFLWIFFIIFLWLIVSFMVPKEPYSHRKEFWGGTWLDPSSRRTLWIIPTWVFCPGGWPYWGQQESAGKNLTWLSLKKGRSFVLFVCFHLTLEIFCEVLVFWLSFSLFFNLFSNEFYCTNLLIS